MLSTAELYLEPGSAALQDVAFLILCIGISAVLFGACLYVGIVAGFPTLGQSFVYTMENCSQSGLGWGLLKILGGSFATTSSIVPGQGLWLPTSFASLVLLSSLW